MVVVDEEKDLIREKKEMGCVTFSAIEAHDYLKA